MVDSYFKNFQRISYANSVALNITDRIKVLDSVAQNPYAFYPMDIQDGTRADQVANRVYGDPFRAWILYLGNQIIDPYYQWYLTPEQFNAYLLDKYSPLPLATLQQQVQFYRNNWYSTASPTLSVSAYDALDFQLRKFFEPNYNGSSSIINYQRKQADWVLSTNEVISYSANGAGFTNNEIVTVNYVDGPVTTGNGQVAFSSNTNLTIQHVIGSPLGGTISGSSYVYGTQSGANVAFTAATLIANNIPAVEAPYWNAVATYDYENELNEYNKSILVLDPRFVGTAVFELKNLLSS